MKTIIAKKGCLDTLKGYIAWDAAISELPAPEEMLQLKPLYEEALAKAASVGAETAFFPSIPIADLNSTMFQAISIIYKTMREFQASHDCPDDIQIICDDDQVLKLYMVVWNLYYAEDKAGRMNDGRWD